MTKATEEQRLQLIAKISTGTDRRKWDGEKLQICMQDPGFDDRFMAFINSSEAPAKKVEEITKRLNLISEDEEIILEATTGDELVIGQSPEIYGGYIEKNFENFDLNRKSKKPTGVQEVKVYELDVDSTFKQAYAELGFDLGSLCLTQPQINQFAMNHSKWFRHDKGGTFFLFESKGEFFVALVGIGNMPLEVRVSRFSHDQPWFASRRFRFVVPQLNK